MRGAPHSGLASAIRRTRQRTSPSVGGRPGGLLERQAQKRRKATRCQRTTVPGLTTRRTSRQCDQARESVTQKNRSDHARRGRRRRRWRDGELLAQGQVLDGEVGVGLTGRLGGAENGEQEREHGAHLAPAALVKGADTAPNITGRSGFGERQGLSS
jgi:hypothetical protein